MRGYLGDGTPCSLAHWDIEVAGRFSEDEVPAAICLPCLDESKVSSDGFLHDVLSSIKLSMLRERRRERERERERERTITRNHSYVEHTE